MVEAVCEFHFESSQIWDWAIPGLVYALVKTEFPLRQQQEMVQFHASSNAAPSVQQGIARLQFLRQDKSALLQIGPDNLVINQLRPYVDWDNFKALIERSLDHYWQAAKPQGIEAVSLRYINRIPFPVEPAHYEDFLTVYPNIPDSRDQKWSNWVQRVEVVREDAGGVLVVQAGSAREDQGEKVIPVVILDLTFVRAQPQNAAVESLKRSDMGEWLETAHDEIEAMFLASLTPRARHEAGEKQVGETL